jgi:hypothetical protein
MSVALGRLAQLANGSASRTGDSGKAVTWSQLRAALIAIDPAWAGHVDGKADASNVTAGEFALIAAKIVRGMR